MGSPLAWRKSTFRAVITRRKLFAHWSCELFRSRPDLAEGAQNPGIAASGSARKRLGPVFATSIEAARPAA
jgi:hypothetical protein